MSVVAVIGLGYVGLPLVVEFGKHTRTIGFDIIEDKVARCRAGSDPSREIPDAEMALAVHAEYTSDPALLREADFILIAGDRYLRHHEPPSLGLFDVGVHTIIYIAENET